MNIILMCCGVLSIIIGLIAHAETIISKLLFKAFPVLFGLYAIFVAMVNFGWVSIK